MLARQSLLSRRFAVWGLGLGLVAQSAHPTSAQSPRPTAAQASASRLRDSSIALINKATPVGDVDGLKMAEALLERALTVAPNDPWLLHYLGFALYREATLRMGRDRQDVGPLIERADSILERSTRLAAIPESHALRSGLLGMMIGSSPVKGMTLGPKSGAQMERAVELAPNNPRVWVVRGIGAIHTPTMFGGGLDKSEEYLKKAIELFANDKPQPPAPSWGLAEAHAWLGQVYRKQDKIDLARAEYQKALAIEPNDMWTRTILLPALDKHK
jgi:tetratricopeptide (TPR) repeat protein